MNSKVWVHSITAILSVGMTMAGRPLSTSTDSTKSGGTARAVAHTLQGYYASLRQHGTSRPWQDRMLDFDGLNRVIGTPELLDAGRRYQGD